jgi:PASTA domain-containing protein
MRKAILIATIVIVAVSAAVLVLAPNSGATKRGPRIATVVVPNVVGMRMDRATRTLKSRGLRVNEECSGLFGCWVKSRWWICAQSPRAGRRLRRYAVVVIYGERRGEC